MPLERFRSGFSLLVVVLLAVALLWVPRANAAEEKSSPSAGPVTKGQRVFTCGHSFHFWIAPILGDMAKSAGIEGHEVVGVSMIGGSRVIQHWNVPDDRTRPRPHSATVKLTCLRSRPCTNRMTGSTSSRNSA